MNNKEIKLFLKTLKEQFGFTGGLDYIFFRKKEKIYILSKNYDKITSENFNINSLGLYIAKIESNSIRLSIEGSQLIGPDSNKTILELDSPDEWLQGNDIKNIKNLKHFVILKYKDDFIGCGFCKKDKILNYIPKSRRLKQLRSSNKQKDL
ncbi:MAG: hypothetical protein ABIB47_00220 [Candidatus Woesearchaeota archaeon]